MTTSPMPFSEPNDYFSTLLHLGQLLNSSLDLHHILETAVEEVIHFVAAERGFILLVETETGRIWGEAVRNIETPALATLLEENAIDASGVSRTIVKSVLQNRQPVVSINAMEDPRFASHQSVQLNHLRSVLCVPLLAKGKLLGIIYLDNRLRSGVFSAHHLAMLTAFANQAAVAIENARLYDGLRLSLEQKLQLQEELHRQETRRMALEEASRLKSDFIGFLAHELRNPLTTIRGYVQTIQADTEHTLDEETRQEFYQAIEADSDRLLDLINELLDASRLEAGRPLTPALKSVEIVPLLDRLVRRHRYYKYFTRHHILTTDFSPDLPTALTADEEKLTQIFSNLLGNALKYSPEGGEVHLTARPDGEAGILVSVKDQGVGLSADQCARLFQQFERIERESIKSIPGTGLGLYMAKHLVELHGGSIDVQSEPGKGSTFTVRLPLTPGS